ncbi:hypothetical protein J2803_002262 [Paraburkholderia phenoliruptrix]|nr:hypothetical protein [Paraburkholderia phenoliruptrix]
MRLRYKVLIGLPVFLITYSFAINTRIPSPPIARPCSEEWFKDIENNYFSTERTNSFGDSVGLDWGGENWFSYIEDKASMPHPSANVKQEERCELLQSHLQSKIYIINDLFGESLSFQRGR